jgi:flagella basal body P-ring formation protein FlgA
MIRPFLLLLLALGTALASRTGCAQTPDHPAEIQRAVAAFARAQTATLPGRVEIAQGPVDSRLKLAPCESMEAFLPTGSRLWGNGTVGVRCLGPVKWSLFVPVQVRVWADVVVTARALTRGQTLTSSDLAVQTLDLTQLPQGLFTDPGPLAGKMVNTRVAGGMPLRPDMLRAATVILQGQAVRLVFTGGGLNVSSEGRALGNAGVGEPVQVRTASGKVIKGIVQGPGVVEVH